MPPHKQLIHSALTESIIGAFFEVYFELGFGFFEAIYGDALDLELAARGHTVGREVPAVVMYKGKPLRKQRIDRVVDDKVIIELKSTSTLPLGSKRQAYNYLRATRYEVALVLHFGLEPKFHRLAHGNIP